jgi:hypothetical protein
VVIDGISPKMGAFATLFLSATPPTLIRAGRPVRQRTLRLVSCNWRWNRPICHISLLLGRTG